jgi:Fe-S oxidoreductase
VDYGGSLTGEHGDGQARAEFLPLMFGEELMEAMRTFKRIWDPKGLMNPGKVVDAYRVDENLRMGPVYKRINVHTRLNFRSPEGDGFQRAIEHCVGMARCRSEKGGTMCPSYRATKDERFSTRGRSRLFWEMLQGEVIQDGWRSPAVKEALDTCLACKGCRSDCPTHTDMASYKAEFLSHYYEDARRPRQALTMGRIGDWAPLAGKLPWLANLMTQHRYLAPLTKKIGGVAAQRDLPRFAQRGYRRQHPAPAPTGQRVILWVDTFCEHFHPEVAQAAVAVLKHAGYEAELPTEPLCCGRPLYDFGYLDLARARLGKILDVIGPQLGEADAAAGSAGHERSRHDGSRHDGSGRARPVAIVGLEPGCMSVFKDELLKLFPDDPRAQQVSRMATLLGDFLHDAGYRPPRLDRQVLVHAHCHQKSLFGIKGDVALLAAMGVNARHLDSGCCGMAGSFGFNPDHAELSLKVGEQSLLPAVRAATADTIVLTNGFSCREQIRQSAGREVMHLAELLQLALTQEAEAVLQPG